MCEALSAAAAARFCPVRRGRLVAGGDVLGRRGEVSGMGVGSHWVLLERPGSSEPLLLIKGGGDKMEGERDGGWNKTNASPRRVQI